MEFTQDYSVVKLSNTRLASNLVKEVADTWFRPDGSAKTRAMTSTMILDTMATYNLSLMDAAKLFEKAMSLYRTNLVEDDSARSRYWEMVRDLPNKLDVDATVKMKKQYKKGNQ